jgi:hypothetical protein
MSAVMITHMRDLDLGRLDLCLVTGDLFDW